MNTVLCMAYNYLILTPQGKKEEEKEEQCVYQGTYMPLLIIVSTHVGV